MTEPPRERIAREQAERRRDMERLDLWARMNPDRVAGFGWDTGSAKADGGTVRYFVGVVGDCGAASAELEALLDRPDLLDVIPQRFTWAELLALRDRIAAECVPGGVHGGAQRGTSITMLVPEVMTNRVCIGLNNADERYALELLERYGSDRVCVEYGVRGLAFPEM